MTFFMQQLLLWGCIVLAVFFLMEYVFYQFGGEGKIRILKRLGERSKGDKPAGVALKRILQDDSAARLSIDRYFLGLISKADSEVTLSRLYLVIAAISVCIIISLTIFVPYIPFPVTVILGLVIGFGLPVLMLKKEIKKRYNKFEEQFPDAIELIVRSLRVGQPLSIAMQTVGKEMPDPMGKEFDLVSQEIAYGKDVPDALMSMLQRIELQDLRFFVVAVQIQHESGGNLAEILEGLSKIIRGRFRLKRKVKALTAEGRFSAWFLSIFPVFMIFVMNTINPGYYQKVSDFEYFPHLTILLFVMLIINVVAMKIITSVKV